MSVAGGLVHSHRAADQAACCRCNRSFLSFDCGGICFDWWCENWGQCQCYHSEPAPLHRSSLHEPNCQKSASIQTFFCATRKWKKSMEATEKWYSTKENPIIDNPKKNCKRPKTTSKNPPLHLRLQLRNSIIGTQHERNRNSIRAHHRLSRGVLGTKQPSPKPN